MKFKVGDILRHKNFKSDARCKVVSIFDNEYELERIDIEVNDTYFQSKEYVEMYCELEE